ncbi:MAG TPA: DUF1003 domain-containing protein [Anaerolineales bacterium]|nr:DUF1003 domain-containing protein [Anaerolineales bacterium]HLE72713.1 DUF1003 domain-containing protein [Anaerolineales bacterium]
MKKQADNSTPSKIIVEELGEVEKEVFQHLRERKQTSRNVNLDLDKKLTFGQRLADRIAGFGGSWTFICIFLGTLAFWVVLNYFILANIGKTFDPYPYILLNLFLSMLASLQAPLILMSQNRQSLKDRISAEHDYEVNLKAELEIMALHKKIDDLRLNQWKDLMAVQEHQIALLQDIIKGFKQKGD